MTSQFQYSRNLLLSFMIFFNNCIRSSSFLEILKKAKVTQAFKKVDRSKFSTKKLIYLQLNNYMQKKKKKKETRHALLKRTESWKPLPFLYIFLYIFLFKRR